MHVNVAGTRGAHAPRPCTSLDQCGHDAPMYCRHREVTLPVIHADQHDHGFAAICTNARVDMPGSCPLPPLSRNPIRRLHAADPYAIFPLDYTQLYQR